VICSVGGKTCGACCWSGTVSRDVLTARLRRHRGLFARHLNKDQAPHALALLWHELRARRGADLLWAPLLWLPFVGPRLRTRLAARAVCAFAAFRDEDEQRVGCLLHPQRWNGHEIRPRAAFRLLRGFGCGSPDYACAGASRFAAANGAGRARFLDDTRSLDWFAYSAVAPLFAADRHVPATSPEPRSAACPSSSTRPSR